MCHVYKFACNLESRWLHEFQLFDLQGLPSESNGKEQVLAAHGDIEPDLVLAREIGLPPLLRVLLHHELVLLHLVFNLGDVVLVARLLALL